MGFDSAVTQARRKTPARSCVSFVIVLSLVPSVPKLPSCASVNGCSIRRTIRFVVLCLVVECPGDGEDDD